MEKIIGKTYLLKVKGFTKNFIICERENEAQLSCDKVRI